MKKLIFFIAVGFILASCQFPVGQSADQILLQCETYYRSSQSSNGDPQQTTSIFELGQSTLQHTEEFEDMVLIAELQVNEYEGNGLHISISDPETGRPLASSLYQFRGKKMPENQFSGGHGFTGLAYINHPQNPSQLQYFCSSVNQ
jgi:hypothetical protein